MRKKKEIRCDLKFRSFENEQAFEASRQIYQVNMGRIQLFLLLIMSLGGWIINPYNLDRKILINLCFNITKIVSATLILVLTKYKPRWTKFIYFISILSLMVGYIENGRVKGVFKKEINVLITGGILQYLNLSCIIVKLPWTWSGFLIILSSLLILFRLTDFSINYEQNFFPLYSLIANMVLLIFCSYMLERFERLSFLERNKYEHSLKSFKHITRDVLPCSVIICNQDGVLFFNKDAQRVFNVRSKNKILKKLEQVFVQEKGPNFIKERGIDLFQSENSLFNFDDEDLPHQGIDSGCFDKKFHHLPSVLDFKILEKTNFKKEKFTNYYGKYRNHEEPGNSLDEIRLLHFDIKIGDVIWEGLPAKMILLIEDPLIQKMNFFWKRDIYKNKLLATVSHDLRTPLNGIIGMVESAKAEVSEPSVRKSLEIALISSEHLMLMINDILDISQINNGSLRLNVSSLSISKCVEDVCNLVSFQAKRKGLTFSIENLSEFNDPTIPILSDPLRLKQILFNIIGNALKFTDHGFVKVRYGWSTNFREWDQYEKKAVIFEIEDSGHGIKKTDIKNIFRMFGKLENEKSPTVNTTGVGIGLSISQNLVRSLNKFIPGAEISVESQPGLGSCFKFPLISYSIRSEESLPLNDIEERLETDLPFLDAYSRKDECIERFLKTVSFDEKKRVLIVDDDQINILVATEFIKSYGNFIYETAFNGSVALELVKSRSFEGIYFDVILMDCNMPVIDGYQATRQIIKLVREQIIPPVPIIAVTANTSPQDMDECFSAGMVDFLSKPFRAFELKKKIDDALMNQRYKL